MVTLGPLAYLGSLTGCQAQWYNRGMTKSHVTNAQVAHRLGMTEGGVSRIRSGDRHPSPPTMKAIEDQYGWLTADQWELAHFGKPHAYANRFEEILAADAEKQAVTEGQDD